MHTQPGGGQGARRDPLAYWEARAYARGATAGDYNDPVMRAFEAPLRRHAFFAQVPWLPGIRIMDVGTGTGEWAVEFWRRGAIVTGIDISPEMIRMARERASENDAPIRYEVAQIQSIPKEFVGQFDMVTSITVLQHLLGDNELAEALTQCARALRPDGHFVCMESAVRAVRWRRSEYMEYRNLEHWLTHFERAGFAPVRVTVVRRVPLVLQLYRVYARVRWPGGPPLSLTRDGYLWCAILRFANAWFSRLLPGNIGGDLTLFVLRRAAAG